MSNIVFNRLVPDSDIIKLKAYYTLIDGMEQSRVLRINISEITAESFISISPITDIDIIRYYNEQYSLNLNERSNINNFIELGVIGIQQGEGFVVLSIEKNLDVKALVEIVYANN